MVLVKVQSTIATESGKQISILWEMSNTPDRRFVSQLLQSSVTLLRVVCFHVEDMEFRFEGRYYQFVHVDVWSIEFDATNAVRDICVPTQAVCLQIEKLNVTVIVARHETSFLLVECVSESDGPAVWLDGFTVRWL